MKTRTTVTTTHEVDIDHDERPGWGSRVLCLDCDFSQRMLSHEGAEYWAKQHVKETRTQTTKTEAEVLA